jgi:hypothetical protein
MSGRFDILLAVLQVPSTLQHVTVELSVRKRKKIDTTIKVKT